VKPPGTTRGLRTLALFEAAKGVVVLLVGWGGAGLLHHHAHHMMETMVSHFHLNPAHHTPQVFLKLAADFDNSKLWLLAGGAAAYATIRFVEAWGLWRGRRWAEWLGCIGAGIYIPLEFRHFIHHPGFVSTLVLGTNLIIVVYVAVCLWRGRNERRPKSSPDDPHRDPWGNSPDGLDDVVDVSDD
jgi:uncharacterized membrane protein (DUF2068 family)